MSTLTLIRHGQARAFEKDSDRLSEVGEEQARRLGEFWRRGAVRFDEVYTGTLERQKATGRIVAAAIKGFPEPVSIAGLDEYDAPGVLGAILPELASRDQRFAAMVADYERTRDNRTFQRVFEVAMRHWISASIPIAGAEPWTSFEARVLDGLRQIMGGAGNRRIAVFTSGGPIGLAVKHAMQSPSELFLDLHWRIRNCSLTDFVFSGARVTLDSFNAIPHLDDPSLWTYR